MANLFRIVAIVGLAAIAVGFVLYTSGAIPSLVSPRGAAQLWHLSSEELADYHESSWRWDKKIGSGESLSLATIVLIPAAIIVCMAIMAGLFLKEKERVYSIILTLQVLVLLLAASGILAAH